MAIRVTIKLTLRANCGTTFALLALLNFLLTLLFDLFLFALLALLLVALLLRFPVLGIYIVEI